MGKQTDDSPAGPRPARPAPADTTAAAGATVRTVPEDLSSEVARTVPRRPGDDVRCTRVGGDTYRCNWWAAQASVSSFGAGRGDTDALAVATHRVRKSQFLRATRTDGRLVITRCPPGPLGGVTDDGG